MTRVQTLLEPPRDHADLLELRQASLQLALVATFALCSLALLLPDVRRSASGLFAAQALTLQSDLWVYLIATSVLVGDCVAWALRRWVRLSASLLVASLGMGLVLSLNLLPPDTTVPWLALLVLLSGALLGRVGVVLTAAAITGFLALAPGTMGVALSVEAARGAQVMVWVAVALSWLTTQPLYTALNWSWSSFQQALAKTQELEYHQGELARALKGLDDACYRLEAANQELERARKAADEAYHLKTRFAAFVSHELRLPLNIVTGFSEMMLMSPSSYDGESLPTAYRSDLEAVYRAAHHLSTLIDDVLDLSEVDAHQMALQKDWESLGEIVEEATAAVRGLFDGKGLSLAVCLPESLPPGHFDRTRIRQVIMNLLKNAARFTDVGGVEITAAVRDNDLVVAVADSGIGIPEGDLPHVFEEFYQADRSTGGDAGRALRGSGLGLTISKRLVEMHGGSMWVESRVGKGSAFYFSLPLCDNVAAAPLRAAWQTWARALPALGGQPTGPTVPVLTQDERVLRLLQRALESYHLVPVASAEELRVAASTTPARAAIVVRPGGGESRPMFSERALALPGVPVIECLVWTARSSLADLGVADYLVKPVDRSRLGRVLADVGDVERVVIVDDDAEMVRLLTAMVRSLRPGCRIWQALDGERALALIRAHRPGVVLLDLLMPGMDGQAVLRQLRADAELRDTPVVVVTAGAAVSESVAGEISAVSRREWLGADELCRCLRGILGSLGPAPDSLGAPSGEQAGSPAS